jgi:hypothetical protein
MLNDIDLNKNKLKELSEVLNLFKSEAVQLRIVEFLFNKSNEDAIEVQTTKSHNTKSNHKTKKILPKNGKITKTDKIANHKKTSSSPGQSVILEELIQNGWFEKPKTIGDIIKYCTENHAKKFKSTDISPYLVSRIRNNTLKRIKNPETKQYEYTKK